MKQFEIELREQCQKRGGARARRVLRFLDRDPKGKAAQQLHARRLKAMEDRAASEVRMDAMRDGIELGAIDWSQIDWDKLFANIIKLIEMLIAAFT